MIIGTCSICGGPVEVPDVWHGVVPPVPQCRECHAVQSNYGPVIDMKPSKTITTNKFNYPDDLGKEGWAKMPEYRSSSVLLEKHGKCWI